MVWLRISPNMDFYMEMELQKVSPRTTDDDVQQYEKIVREEFLERLTKAFPEGNLKMHGFEFGIAREKHMTLT